MRLLGDHHAVTRLDRLRVGGTAANDKDDETDDRDQYERSRLGRDCPILTTHREALSYGVAPIARPISLRSSRSVNGIQQCPCPAPYVILALNDRSDSCTKSSSRCTASFR